MLLKGVGVDLRILHTIFPIVKLRGFHIPSIKEPLVNFTWSKYVNKNLKNNKNWKNNKTHC